MLLPISSLLASFTLLVLADASLQQKKVKHLVFLGDSYTDQSRSHSISNGTWPGKNYQEIYPPADTSADGGVQWPWYLGLYANATIHNYAVGGAVCNNSNSALFDIPDVVHGQEDWFVEDHITGNGTAHQVLRLDPSEFVVILWIGTNDLGINNFATDDQRDGVSLADVANCQIESIRRMYSFGARRFIVNSLIPLELAPLYNGSSAPVIYWPYEHDGEAWHKRMQNFVATVNTLVKLGVKDLKEEWKGQASVEWFDTYSLFKEMYDHPENYFNGTLPPTSHNWCHRCDVPTDWHYCGIGDCVGDERDSFMWWDELHPSEQAGRVLADEIWKKINGKSHY
ncbi:GDSL lipase/esterase [Flagelloscypha sp. PMI_526]|nr:GDSL lipase/esterase [Flagelloscypha sp. PMI_526]